MGRIFIPGLQGIENFVMPRGNTLEFVKSKEEIFNYLCDDMLTRTIKMFKYSDYPETFSPWAFEMGLQTQGFIVVARCQPTLNDMPEGIYALRGVGFGGVLDDRFLPTRAVGQNPYLGVSIEEEFTSDNVAWVWNDSTFMGLTAVNNLYAGLLADAYISLRLKMVLTRAPAFPVASDEDEKIDAMRFLQELDEGKLGVIGRKSSLEKLVGSDGFSTKPNLGDGNNSIKEIIEAIQYLYAQWNIKLGLNDNYNMKREALNSSETSANEDTLYTLIEDMYETRKEAIEDMNRKFGTSIKVELAGEWKRIFEKRKLADEAEEKSVEAMPENPKEPQEEPPANTPNTEEVKKDEEIE